MITIINSTNVNVEGLEETFNAFFKNYQITDKLYLEAYHPSKYFLLKGYFGDLKPSFRKYMEMAEESTELNDWKTNSFFFFRFEYTNYGWKPDPANTKYLYYAFNPGGITRFVKGNYTGMLEVHEEILMNKGANRFIKDANTILEKGFKDIQFVCEMYSKFGVRENLEKIEELKKDINDLEVKTLKILETLVKMREDFN